MAQQEIFYWLQAMVIAAPVNGYLIHPSTVVSILSLKVMPMLIQAPGFRCFSGVCMIIVHQYLPYQAMPEQDCILMEKTVHSEVAWSIILQEGLILRQ